MSNAVGNLISSGRPERKEETARIQRLFREQAERQEMLRQQRKQAPPAAQQQEAHGS